MNPLAVLNPATLIAPPAQALAQAIAHALGWTLLHFLWQGTLIAAILACLLSLLSERSPQPRYLAACTALVLMIATPIITFTRLLAQQYREAHAITTFSPLDPITINATGTLSEPLLYRLTSALDRSMPALLALWFAGVLLLLGRLSMGLIIARQMKSLSTEPAPPDLLSTFRQLTHRIGVSRPVRLLHSALVQVPTVIGWLRPVVLFPIGCLAGLSPTQLEAILAHELAHIRRHDYLISVLQSVVEALLFYHPAVWWVSHRIRTEREHCCDDLAVRIGGNPLTYARALSLLAERSASLPAIALGANGGILTMRIKRLLTPKEGPATSQLAAVTLLGIVIAATGLCITTAARAQAQNQTQNKTQPTPTVNLTPAARPQPATNNQQLATNLTPVFQKSPLPQDVFQSTPQPVTSAAPSVAPKPTSRPSPKPAPIRVSYSPAPAPQSPSTDSKPPAHVAAGVMAGQVVSRVNPIYPPDAKAAHVEGAVVLRAVISTTGDIKQLEVISGPEMLMKSATDAVGQWKYKPYLLNGQPIEVETTITVNYHFEASPPPSDARNTTQNVTRNIAQNVVQNTVQNAPNQFAEVTPGPTPTGVQPKKIGGSVSAPKVIHQVEPEFSDQAKQDKTFTSGNVLVHLWVDQNGNPSHVHVIRGVGEGLDEKAIEAVKQYKFTPAMEDGKPVLVELNIEVNFQRF
jgi:TonB family protein